MVFVKCPFLAPCVGPQTQTEFMDKGSPGTLTQPWEEGWWSRGPGGRAPSPPDTGEGDPPSLLASPPLLPQGAESEGWCYSAASWAAGEAPRLRAPTSSPTASAALPPGEQGGDGRLRGYCSSLTVRAHPSGLGLALGDAHDTLLLSPSTCIWIFKKCQGVHDMSEKWAGF